jgi:SAM-dependent methyltransferase
MAAGQLRRVDPEWLDELPQGEGRARRARRDLQRVNALMMQPRAVQRAALRGTGSRPPREIVELGSGDGTFLLRVARRLAPMGWRELSVTMVDRQDIVAEKTRQAFRALGWEVEVAEADVFDFLAAAEQESADLIVANLFLHHFDDARLADLLRMAADVAPCFVACEPRRSALALAGSRLLWAIGCNDVTRHDAVVSVKAGFRGQELSALWPKNRLWQLSEGPAGLFSHAFVARRIGAAVGAR